MSTSYTGMELLPELLRSGRLDRLIAAGYALRRKSRVSLVALASITLGPFIPKFLWRFFKAMRGGNYDVRKYTAIKEDKLTALALPKLAHERGFDFTYRPWRDGFSMRLWVLRRFDMGNYNKGVLGGWGIDQRDPTGDKRLVEFCLSVPTEQFILKGTPRSLARRAFADRLPLEVLHERLKGAQAVDWHEGLTAGRQSAAEEIERLTACGPAAATIDLARLRDLVENWPKDGWDRESIRQSYRLALLRGLSTGHFLRRACSNSQ